MTGLGLSVGVLQRAGRIIIQGNMSGPRDVQTVLGAFRNGNVDPYHPNTLIRNSNMFRRASMDWARGS